MFNSNTKPYGDPDQLNGKKSHGSVVLTLIFTSETSKFAKYPVPHNGLMVKGDFEISQKISNHVILFTFLTTTAHNNKCFSSF